MNHLLYLLCLRTTYFLPACICLTFLETIRLLSTILLAVSFNPLSNRSHLWSSDLFLRFCLIFLATIRLLKYNFLSIFFSTLSTWSQISRGPISSLLAVVKLFSPFSTSSLSWIRRSSNSGSGAMLVVSVVFMTGQRPNAKGQRPKMFMVKKFSFNYK